MTNPEDPQKLTIIEDSLKSNDEVVLVYRNDERSVRPGHPTPNGRWSHFVDLYAHPKEPLYDPDELNEFMDGLVPLEPRMSDKFWVSHNKKLETGKLYFDEPIGSAVLTATVELIGQDGIPSSWQESRDLTLMRRTLLRVFPNGEHTRNAIIGKNEFEIPVCDLKPSEPKRSRVARLLGRATSS